MSPSAFVGIPDWRSAVLAALLTLPWLLLLARGRVRSAWVWVALAAAAALFPFSIALIQVPIQSITGLLLTSIWDMPTLQRYLPIAGLPAVAVSGLVQESVKLLVTIAALRMLSRSSPAERRRARAGLAVGAASGAGYGGFEAFWVFNQIFGVGWSWASVQLGGVQALAGFVERFFAVPFHVGVAALAGYGYATGRPWRFWLLAAGLHALANYVALLVQAGLVNALAAEVWIALCAVVAMSAALWLRWKVS